MSIIWLKKELVIAVHDELIAMYGGMEGVRDPNSLESSLMAPQHFYFYTNPFPSLTQLACKYAFSLTKNHPFNDGNKRTAFFSCMFFLEENGVETHYDEMASYFMMMDLSTDKINEEEFNAWLSKGLE